MSESQPLVSDEDIVSRYPAPIAGAWQRVIATRELLDIHKYLLKVYEATLTYLVVVLASQYHQANERDTQVDETIRQIGGKVSLGQWTGMLRGATSGESAAAMLERASQPHLKAGHTYEDAEWGQILLLLDA